MSERLTFNIGSDEIVIRQRWEVASIANDIVIALWFIVGSVMFMSESTKTAGVWFFLAGSIELMIRPAIRLARRIHLRRIGGPQSATDDSDDY